MSAYSCCCDFGWEFTRSVKTNIWNVRRYARADGSTVWSLDACGGAARILDMYAMAVSHPVNAFSVVAQDGLSLPGNFVEYYTDSGTAPSLQWGKTKAQIISDSVVGFISANQMRVCLDSSLNTYVSTGYDVIKYNSSGVKQWAVTAGGFAGNANFTRGAITGIDTDGTYVFTANTATGGLWSFARRNAGRIKCSDGSSQFPTLQVPTSYSTNENTDWIRIGYSAASPGGIDDITRVAISGSDVYFIGRDFNSGDTLWKLGKGSTYWRPTDPVVWDVNPTLPTCVVADSNVAVGQGHIWDYRSATDGSSTYTGTYGAHAGGQIVSLAIDADTALPRIYVVDQFGNNGWVTCFLKGPADIVFWAKLWPEVGPNNRIATKAFKIPTTNGVYVCGDRVGDLVA